MGLYDGVDESLWGCGCFIVCTCEYEYEPSDADLRLRASEERVNRRNSQRQELRSLVAEVNRCRHVDWRLREPERHEIAIHSFYGAANTTVRVVTHSKTLEEMRTYLELVLHSPEVAPA